jgi:hypothetical protein
MWGKKDRNIPDWSDESLFAYITRVEPKKAGDKRIDGKVDGHFDGFHSRDELEEMVSEQAGGGEYRAKLHPSDDKSRYIGSYTFRISGPVKRDGKVVDDESEKKTKQPKKVEELKNQMEEIEAQAKVDEAKVLAEKRRRDARKQLEPDDDSTVVVDDSSEVDTLREEFARFREETQQREEKTRENEKFERLERKIEQMASSGGGNIMDAIKSVVESGQSQMQNMLTAIDSNRKETNNRMAEIMQMILSKSDGSAGAIATMQARNDALLEKLFESKSTSSEHTLTIMKDAWETGIKMGRGKTDDETGPTTMADVAMTFTEKISGVLADYFEMRKGGGGVSQDALKREIAPVVRNIMRQLPATSQAAQNPHANARLDGNEIEEAENESVTKAMDQVLTAFIEDAQAGKTTDRWMALAIQVLPQEIVNRLMECMKSSDISHLYEILDKYGSPDLVAEAKKVMQQIAEKMQEPNAPEPPKTPPKAPPKVPPKTPAPKSKKKARAKPKVENKLQPELARG